jgi:molybdopterin synthase sulfur carrier subunit
MELQVLAFAQARQQLGFSQKTFACDPNETARQILARIAPDYVPGQTRVAVDMLFVDWDKPIGQARELALIPPVSGG